jgi:hypothetical protein
MKPKAKPRKARVWKRWVIVERSHPRHPWFTTMSRTWLGCEGSVEGDMGNLEVVRVEIREILPARRRAK